MGTGQKKEKFLYDKGLSSYSIYVNVLIDTVKAIVAGYEEEDNLREQFFLFKELYRKMRLLFENLKYFLPEEKKPFIPLLNDRLEDFLNSINSLEGYFIKKDKALLCLSVQNICTVSDNLFSIFRELKGKEEKVFCRSPLFNELLLILDKVEMENYPLEGLIEKLDFLEEFLVSTKNQIYLLTGEPDSVTFLEEVPKVLSNFDACQEGLGNIRKYTADKNRFHLRKGREIILKALKKLYFSLDILYDAAGIISKVICLNCGYKNKLSSTHCIFCGSLLPLITSDYGRREEEPFVSIDFQYLLTDNLSSLVEAANGAENGEKSGEELRGEVVFFEEKLENIRCRVEACIEDKAVSHMADIFLALLNEMKTGVEELKCYFQREEKYFLDEGLNIIFDVSKVLLDFQALGEEAEDLLQGRGGRK